MIGGWRFAVRGNECFIVVYIASCAVVTGYLVLDDMHIKKSLLDTLELPLALRHGIIGRLEVKIPWSNLGRDPVVVAIDRVRQDYHKATNTAAATPVDLMVPPAIRCSVS